ncbi:alkylated DNA repair protein alkB homolog 8 isoform X1 [Octopus bimaculoides]|uniref:tRNA (carboxymethyluridine(34)-5-O)-methyltransferase n=2 Tax=Octopus bimaculoides TaxID=37653 RepID=A0A0L8G6M1_OCTBM|nr:alkylated DNA repair protein alkB homolog 8 isoform X1 [Octopus bimaculoides]|eukprot:XP_014783678.1 PREDICTED: alkylated DNA repair protein alkB homolog 8-like isoform X1 [Octopus bimaculoides]
MAAPMSASLPIIIDKKVKKKLQRCRHTLRKLDNISLSNEQTNILCVFNGGLDTGVSKEEIEEAFCEDVRAEEIIMLPQRPYAFICYLSTEDAVQAANKLNGTKLSNGNNIYISFLKTIPSCLVPSTDLPPGLILLKDFISEDYETQLISAIEWADCDNPTQTTLKHRKTKHYGYEFLYSTNNVDPSTPLPCGIPPVCDKLISKVMQHGLINHCPDQLTVNQYLPGQGIPPHVDTPSAFEDGIVSLSLGSMVVMEFHHSDGHHRSVILPQRSLLVMTGESRYIWSHGITPRKSDIVPLPDSSMTLVKRETRISFTFRKLASENSMHTSETLIPAKTASENGKLDPSALEIPETRAANLEVTHVHQVYNEIADHFSHTRHSPWPKVKEFLQSLQDGALVADIGCGNGKYFGVNPSIYQIGSDRSENLINICKERNFEVFVGDVMAIPLRSNTFDACICIAVIHHLSTKQRRLQAVKELVRLLCPGGKALIQVWAMEQEVDNQESKYIRKKSKPSRKDNPSVLLNVNNTSQFDSDLPEIADIKLQEDIGNTKPNRPPTNSKTANSDNVESAEEPLKLAVHVNRTSFKQQDLLLPWTKKVKKTSTKADSCNDNSVLYRYYHVFQDGELVDLCQNIDNVDILQYYYDEGNWCVVLKKLLLST